MSELRERVAADVEAFARLYASPRPLSLGGFVLAHGREFVQAKSLRGIRRRKPGKCFANAARVAWCDDRWVYCEGLAWRGQRFLPLHHAWLVGADDGRVVDLTWGRSDDAEYLGVAFQSEFVEGTVLGQGWFGLLDGPCGVSLEGFEAFRHPLQESWE